MIAYSCDLCGDSIAPDKTIEGECIPSGWAVKIGVEKVTSNLYWHETDKHLCQRCVQMVGDFRDVLKEKGRLENLGNSNG